jgi:hypothetical protein
LPRELRMRRRRQKHHAGHYASTEVAFHCHFFFISCRSRSEAPLLEPRMQLPTPVHVAAGFTQAL